MSNTFRQNIISLLNGFEQVSLPEIDKLMLDRYESKYVMRDLELPGIFSELKDHYKILDIEGNRIFNYENVYFDDNDLSFYTDHHNGKLNRYKLRIRNYKEADRSFFEIKFKNNKFQTIKERIEIGEFSDCISSRAAVFLESRLGRNAEEFKPALRSSYKRITLAHKEIPEKVTFDTDLTFSFNGSQKRLPGISIIEIKHRDRHLHSLIEYLMNKRKIRPMRISKYCSGIVMTHPEAKYNRFKQKMLFLNKLGAGNNEFHTSSLIGH